MAAPRKVFRIEETAAVAVAPAQARTPLPAQKAAPDIHHAEVMQALAALRGAMASAASAVAKSDRATRGASRPLVEAGQFARITQELAAVTSGTDQATQKILAAAEDIDQLANNLSAALKGSLEQGLAQDISDLVVRIFEACNFQDLIGQRVTKVMATLNAIEERVAGAVKDGRCAPQDGRTMAHLHGPRLETDSGHMTQQDIDALFAGSARA